MAEPLNTNNSLSDLNNEEFVFNEYLTNANKKELKNARESEKGYTDEINAQRRLRSQAKTDKDRQKIDKEIGLLQQDLDNLRKEISVSGADGRSLFDRTAYVDYARIYDGDNNWEHYKKGGEFGTFLRNNTNALNEPVSGDSVLPVDDGLSLRHLIQWSESYPALQLRSQDFAYCKNLGVYPNNRLIVLRRFRNGIPDNLFDYYEKDSPINDLEYLQPISTLINWIKPNQEFIRLRFNEVWGDFDGNFLESITGKDDKNSTTDLTSGVKKEMSSLLKSGVLSLMADGAKFKREDGIKYLNNAFSGNPNLINRTKKRKTGGGGMSSKLSFDMKFEYEMRYINNIDPGVAMLDLISNCLRMGTSTAYFKFPISNIKDNDIVKKAITGQFQLDFEKVKKALSGFKNSIVSTMTNLIAKGKKLAQEIADDPNVAIDAAIDNTVKFVISKYKENLKSALAAETGLPSGIWHITMGNPKSPIISCGDLILSSSELKLGRELGFNDFPNEFSVEYTLESARERGRDELERIFNAGKGRVYTYLDSENNSDYGIYKPVPKKEQKKND